MLVGLGGFCLRLFEFIDNHAIDDEFLTFWMLVGLGGFCLRLFEFIDNH
jgi:hypothetical protein